MIVLNKTDLISAADLARVRAAIAQAIPRAVKIVESREGRIAPDVLLGLKAAAEDDLAQRPSHHDAEEGHNHDDFDTFVVDIPAIGDPESFVAKLADVAQAHQALRMKGFFEVQGKPMRLLVQGVGQRFRREFDRPWREGEARRGRLVVIGEKGIDKGAVAAALQG
jgi:cobalamin biosynthesis protein CobW